ncbi:MAG: thiamine pyrophosphate-binding protein [Candidatus Cohnella colombiensis]|uniref:Thiamine pyrophosphate-binding protein n=1 Tax=Candidatus Cohnella colombiensis TaxID=3121368 RepID=A0AA95EVY9_9BACL|nr:MAG: thiamine pyrophosphate-binding protein [Cohnella sp.]
MIKLSDYVIQFIENLGVKDIFLISGGGMMHLLDSAERSPDLNIICNLNEQATSICADSYAQYTNKLGVCLLTTGPGGTNAITGVTASYLDSNPVLVISGQAKSTDLSMGTGVRQVGAQEVDVVAIATPVTKYAVIVMDKQSIRYHLEKAIYLASNGRRGPVWVDIPLDIQGATIDETTLYGFNPEDEGYSNTSNTIDEMQITSTYDLLNQAKRPAFLIGHGVVASDASTEFKQLVRHLGIPVLASWRAKGVFSDSDPLYFGHPGSPGARFSNYILQNTDLLIVIGSRLNAAMTAYNLGNFAPNAKKVIVDIDENEIKRLSIPLSETIVTDASSFVKAMQNHIERYEHPNLTNWLSYCLDMRDKYPLLNEKQPSEDSCVDGYRLGYEITRRCSQDDILVGSSSGRTCGISHMAFNVHEGQKFITSMGLGSMGFTLPSAIASSIAGGKQRTIALEGDGSLQHNLQELQLISTYGLPIKLFVLNNGGYASIYVMQRNHFKNNFSACTPETLLEFPPTDKLAELYGLDYYRIDTNDSLEETLDLVMKDNRPVLCEVMGSILFDEIPKAMTKVNPDGTLISSSLENLYPFLSAEEVNDNMMAAVEKE